MKKIFFVVRTSLGPFKQMHSISSIFYASSFRSGSLTYFKNASGYVTKVISDDDLLGHTLEEALKSKYAKFRETSVREMWADTHAA